MTGATKMKMTRMHLGNKNKCEVGLSLPHTMQNYLKKEIDING